MPATKILYKDSEPKNRQYEGSLPNDDSARIFKFIVVGDPGVGKSSLVLRLTDGVYTESYISTIGVDFKIKRTLIQSNPIKMQVWDAVGNMSEQFRKNNICRGAQGVILVFDLTYLESFENLQSYFEEINRFFNDSVKIVLVGNKADNLERRQVSDSMVDNFLGMYPNIIGYVETSAKTDINVDSAFELLTEERLRRDILMAIHHPRPIANEALNRTLNSHSQKLRKKIHDKSLANVKLNLPVTSDAEIEMWQQKLNTLAVAEKILNGESTTNLAYNFYKAKYSNPLHASGILAQTPKLLAKVEAMLPKNKITVEAKLQAQIEAHIDELQFKIDTAPRDYSFCFWQRDNRAMWQRKIEVLQAAKAALTSQHEAYYITALETATSQNQLYKKGLFSKTEKYVSQVFELYGHSRGA